MRHTHIHINYTHTHTHIFLVLFWISSLYIHNACFFLFNDWVPSTLFIYNLHNITPYMYNVQHASGGPMNIVFYAHIVPLYLGCCRILWNLGVGRWEEQPHVLPRCFVTNAHKLTNKYLLASKRSKYIAYELHLIHLLVTMWIIPSPWRPKETSMKDCLHERNGLKTHKEQQLPPSWVWMSWMWVL